MSVDSTDPIAKLRAKLGTMLDPFSDKALEKFCIARNYNFDKTEKMLRDHVEWKASYNTDNILNEYFGPEICQLYPCGFVGVDRAGNPLYIERPGKCNAKQTLDKFPMEFLLRFHVAVMETGKLKYTSTNGSGVFIIIDAQGIGMSHLDRRAIKFVRTASVVDQNNYPEHLAYCFVINANSFFTTGWKLVSNFIDSKTRNKIKILGKNYASDLLEHIDADQLPKSYGGTAPEPEFEKSFFGSPNPNNACKLDPNAIPVVPDVSDVPVVLDSPRNC